jgi:CRP/FNR family transcriptional regulator, cyclic AMP receptor protein
MISPELLRRFPAFGVFTEEQLAAIAMIAETASCEDGAVICDAGQPADVLRVLVEGEVSLFYEDNIPVGDINPGEMFCLSSMVPPHVLNATVRATKPCELLNIDAAALRGQCESDCHMGYHLLSHIAKAMSERLHYTRVELAACRA